MDKITVAVRNGDPTYTGFTGYVVEHGDEKALKPAKDWARIRNYNHDKKEYDDPIEPNVYTFDNDGFTVKILKSAGGSSQGGRLSFWACEVEKDGIKFTVGVNDAILADLIKNSDISNGLVKQKVMFARKGGQPGLIHKDMDAYQEAVADMKQKADLKKAKKTSKWELGGIYSTLNKMDICLGEVYNTLETYKEEEPYNSSWRYGATRTVTKYRETKNPQKVYAWFSPWMHRYKDKLPTTFEEVLKAEMEDRDCVYFSVGKPPARFKSGQLKVKESDKELLDKLLSLRKEHSGSYGAEPVTGRYVREVKKTK